MRPSTRTMALDRVGVLDSFLELGGDSLKAAAMAAKVHELWKVEVPLRAFFDSPDVARLALSVTQRLAERAGLEQADRLLQELENLTEDQAHQRLSLIAPREG